MAEFDPKRREELTSLYDLPCPKHGNHSLDPAPNDDLPNSTEFDFICPQGYLFQGSEVLEAVLTDGT